MFSKMELDQSYLGYCKEEGVVGQFTSKIFKNNENYLIGHLNSLIHGIMTAINDFDQIMRVETEREWETNQITF